MKNNNKNNKCPKCPHCGATLSRAEIGKLMVSMRRKTVPGPGRKPITEDSPLLPEEVIKRRKAGRERQAKLRAKRLAQQSNTKTPEDS